MSATRDDKHQPSTVRCAESHATPEAQPDAQPLAPDSRQANHVAQQSLSDSVLTQRVIAISPAAVQSSQQHLADITHQLLRRHRAPSLTTESRHQHAAPSSPIQDLSATALEWGGTQLNAPAEVPRKAEALAAGPAPDSTESIKMMARPSLGLRNLSESVDAEWATHSSVSLQVEEEPEPWQRLLHMNIEDAATLRFNRKAAQPAEPPPSDLAELDGVLSSARRANTATFGLNTDALEVQASAELARAQASHPRLLPQRTLVPHRHAIPTGVISTLIVGVAVSLLLLAYALTSFLVCGTRAEFALSRLRCVPSGASDEPVPRLIPVHPGASLSPTP